MFRLLVQFVGNNLPDRSFYLVCAVIALHLVGEGARGNEVPLEHMREMLLTIEVRKALVDDPQLESLNIGVMVDGRVATLWGPVPSQEIKHQAEAVLKKFPYISGVRNQLYVRPGDKPTVMPTPVPDQHPMHTPPQPPAVHREPPATATPMKRLPEQKPSVAATRIKDAIGPPAASASKSDHTTLSPQQVHPAAVVGRALDLDSTDVLEKKLRELQATNSQYTAIRARVLSRDILLTADSNYAAALYEMAQTVARLPGVARVIVREQ